MKPITLFDIDGVLADCGHRLHYADAKNYDKYYSYNEVLKDKRIMGGIDLFKRLRDRWSEVHFVTSRNECCRKATAQWLNDNIPNEYLSCNTILSMRKNGDYRPSSTVKIEQIGEILNNLLYNRLDNIAQTEDTPIVYFVDDDPENVKAVCKEFPIITGITFGIGRMK